jgi:DNA-binding response OmpR family regulator
MMKKTESILNNKRILIVDDEPDVLNILEEEIKSAAPESLIDRAISYQEAQTLLGSWSYDLAILDIMGVRGFDLLECAVTRPNPIPVVILTSRPLRRRPSRSR